MSDNKFSDEELVAYLDEEIEYARVNDIKKAIRTDESLAKRLDDLRVDTRIIKSSLDGLLDFYKMPPRFIMVEQQHVLQMKHLAAASILALSVGLGIGLSFSQPATLNWKDYVAAYQALYTTDTLSYVSNSPQMQQAELERVGAAIGKTISVASLSDFPHLEYKRAQVLGYNGQELVQIAFLTSTGEAIALCILRSAIAEDHQQVLMSKLEGLSSANWRANGYDYLLIGGQDDERIRRLAEDMIAKDI